MQVGLAWVTRNCVFIASVWVLSKYCALLLPEVIRRDCQWPSEVWYSELGDFTVNSVFYQDLKGSMHSCVIKPWEPEQSLWDRLGPGTSDPLQQCLQPGQLLEQQRNCKGLKITTGMCSWANYEKTSNYGLSRMCIVQILTQFHYFMWVRNNKKNLI